MRIFAIITLLSFLGAACSSSGSKTSGNEGSQEVSISEEHLSHIHLDVSGMTCEGCENAIVASINKLDGIQEATASHTHEEAMIVFDSTITGLPAITQAIEDAGYKVGGKSAHPHH